MGKLPLATPRQLADEPTRAATAPVRVDVFAKLQKCRCIARASGYLDLGPDLLVGPSLVEGVVDEGPWLEAQCRPVHAAAHLRRQQHTHLTCSLQRIREDVAEEAVVRRVHPRFLIGHEARGVAWNMRESLPGGTLTDNPPGAANDTNDTFASR